MSSFVASKFRGFISKFSQASTGVSDSSINSMGLSRGNCSKSEIVRLSMEFKSSRKITCGETARSFEKKETKLLVRISGLDCVASEKIAPSSSGIESPYISFTAALNAPSGSFFR